MLDEDMDHIIRDAAENHHPVYNDKAWEKMVKKLDKHLPQKRDGRKYIFILLLFLLLGGGALFTMYQLNREKTKDPGGIAGQKINEDMTVKNLPVEKDHQYNNTTTPGEVNDPAATNTAGEIVPGTASKTGKTGPTQLVANAGSKNNSERSVRTKRITRPGKGKVKLNVYTPGIANDAMALADDSKENSKSQVKENSNAKKKVTITTASPEKEKNNEGAVTASAETPKEDSKKKEINEKQITDGQKKEVTEPPLMGEQKKEEYVKPAEPENKKDLAVSGKKPGSKRDKKKPGKNIAGNFGITVSAGPDVSFISLNRLGKVTMMYGAGLSYNFGKRFTVRTGFYTSDKIYDAAPGQYKTPGGNYPYLINIAADCNVYEIPVSLSYNFGYGKKHNWFGNVGLSSFLMKSEYYDYQYKTPYGQTYNYARTIKDENKHYFSVLTISAGYQYKLSRRVSLQAEPYVKLPLGGVGFGEVKLKSSGLLFTATVKPFAKK